MTDMPVWEPACEDTKNGTGWQDITRPKTYSAREIAQWAKDHGDAEYVPAAQCFAAIAEKQDEIVALRQVVAVLGANQNTEALIELAMEANDLMYANGQRDERSKHHANQCCRICDTHVMPHRGCILR